MKKIIKTFQSPYFKNEKRKILICEPKNLTNNTPVLFFFDGQVLKLHESEFNQLDGIDIFTALKHLGTFVIIAVNSMNHDNFFKYKKRVKELMNQDETGDYLFFNKVKKEILELKKKYKGTWFGFGFSLSGFLVGRHEKLFDQTILVSPYFGKNNFMLPKNTTIFYGKKEYRLFSNKKMNTPIEKIKKINARTKFFEIKNMKHSFSSWNKHFHFILKYSVQTY